MRLINNLLIFIILTSLIGCGPQRKVRYMQKDDDEKESQGLSNSMQVSYTVPDQGLEGNNFTGAMATSYIIIGEKKYYVSSNTSDTIKNYLITLPTGNHQLSINGRFSQEQAMVNGQQTMVNVVEILEIY